MAEAGFALGEMSQDGLRPLFLLHNVPVVLLLFLLLCQELFCAAGG